MPVNDFEKQVQQKMDGLQFAPSDVVWEEVEKQIAAPKKRRLLFLWLPVMVLLLGGAAWIYIAGNGKQLAIENNKDNTPVVAADNDNKKMIQPAENGAPDLKQNATSANETTTPAVISARDATAATGLTERKLQQEKENSYPPNMLATSKNNNTQKAVTIAGSAVSHKIQSKKIIAKNSYKGTAATRDVIMSADQLPAATKRGSKFFKLDLTTAGSSSSSATANTAGEEIADEINKNDITDYSQPQLLLSSTAAVIMAPTADAGVVLQENNRPATNGKQQAKKIKRISWGIMANAGRDNVSSGFNNVFSSNRSYDALYNSGQSSLPATNPGNLNNSNTGPSSVQPGFSWQAVLFGNRQLSKTWSAQFGLGYHYYSTRLTVGSKIDSNKALIQYRTGNSNQFTNQFHFIELPVTLQKQFGTKSRFSINAGLSLSMLLGSNALLYNPQQNSYSADNTVINKTQLGLLAGFGYKVMRRSFDLNVGPRFNYQFSNLFKKELSGSRHLFGAGIGATIIINKYRK